MPSTRKENKTYELDEMEFAPESKFEPKNIDPQATKVRITMWVDGDVILAARAEAKGVNKKYQTLLNERLRDAFISQGQNKPNKNVGLSNYIGYSTASMDRIEALIDQKLSKELKRFLSGRPPKEQKKDSKARGPVMMRKKSLMKRTKSA